MNYRRNIRLLSSFKIEALFLCLWISSAKNDMIVIESGLFVHR